MKSNFFVLELLKRVRIIRSQNHHQQQQLSWT